MCGIFGWVDVGCSKSERTAIATILSLENDNRGGDSWGYWQPGEEPRKGLGKLASNVPSPTFSKMRTVLAHTRFATQGTVKKSNAHPFTYGAVTGAHNGVIWNSYDLDIDYPERECDVDSEHLIQHIAEGLPLHELEGYGAVEYTDTRDPGAVYLGRFNGGELAIAALKCGGFVWSSDRRHLLSALIIAGLDFRLLTLKEGRLYRVTGASLKKAGLRLDCGTDRYGGFSGYLRSNCTPGYIRKTYKIKTRTHNKHALPDWSYPDDDEYSKGTGTLEDMRVVNAYLESKDGVARELYLPAPAWETEPVDEEESETYAG